MLRICISNERQSFRINHADGPIEIGRGPQRLEPRLVVEDRFISRDQVRIEELSDGKIRLTNLGESFKLSDGKSVAQSAKIELVLPVRLAAGYTQVEVADADQPEEIEHIPLQTIATPQQQRLADPQQTLIQSFATAPSPEILTQWFERLLLVQRAAAGSRRFYDETARAVVDLVGLDRGVILLRRKGRWDIAADHCRQAALVDRSEPEVSQRVLSQVLDQKRTFFEPLDETSRHSSLANAESVVASPILSWQGNVIGVVYGVRLVGDHAKSVGIQPLEAQVVQLLAAAAGSGLARMEQETVAIRNRVQFEQFCSPELARALERDPTLLDGHETTVSVMFCDIRRFSTIAERTGTQTSYEILTDVMEALTSQIIQHAGIIIDYHGDGFAAMWNAPEPQDAHVTMACRAAQAIYQQVPALNDKWSEIIGLPLRFGIGVNTGSALVGNAGSRRRMKYGPQGSTVNLASRVEGATKQFGVPILITDATQQLFADTLATRRIRQVRVVGIEEAIDLYELCQTTPDERWHSIRRQYQEALDLFERGDWNRALDCLEPLRDETGEFNDKPSQLLAKHAIDCRQQPPRDFDGVLQLQSK